MNRIAGNVLIVDSAMGNAFVLNSSNSFNLNKFSVNAIAFWAVDTSGAFLMTGANTATDLIFKHDGTTAALNPRWYNFGAPQRMTDMKVPVVTSGTAFLYLV